MSATDTEQAAAVWRDWVHRRTPVAAIQYDGSEACRDVIADRVNRSEPGLARVTPAGELLIRMQVRSAPVPTGYWVGIGYNGHPWVISHEVFIGCYDPAGVDFGTTMAPDQVASILEASTGTADPRELRRLLVALAKSHEQMR